MGENPKALEIPADQWLTGFDVDFGFDGPGNAKVYPSTFDTAGDDIYNDIHPLSCVLNRFDDLHSSNITQISDLNSSLPKVDGDSSMLSKLTSNDLGNEFGTAVEPEPKSFDSSLFTHSVNDFHNGINDESVLSYTKQSIHPADVYGKVATYGGKLVVQLRHFNFNTNYPVHVNECWICGEKMSQNVRTEHSHILQASFQVNYDYIQLDIDIDPDNACIIDPGEISGVLPPSSDLSEFNAVKDLDLSESLCMNSESLEISANAADMAYSIEPESALISSAKSGAFSYSSCINPLSHVLSGPEIGLQDETFRDYRKGTSSRFKLPDMEHIVSNPVLTDAAVKGDPHSFNYSASGSTQYTTQPLTETVGIFDSPVKESITVFDTENQCSYSALSNTSPSALKQTCNSLFDTLEQLSCNQVNTDSKSAGTIKKVETGAKKRKSKAYKKQGFLVDNEGTEVELNDDINQVSCSSLEHKEKTQRIVDNVEISQDDSEPATEVTSTVTNANLKVKSNKKNELNMSCRKCGEEFGRKVSAYKEHMKGHGIPESEFFLCNHCSKSFGKRSCFISHLRKHRTARLKCDICDLTYSNSVSLQRHKIGHTNIRPYKCSLCEKSYRRKEYLDQHIKVHSGGSEKLKCSICGSLQSSKFNLQVHKKTHFELPYKCSLCDRGFVRKDFLEKHVEQTHHQHKFKCEVCHKLFSRKDVMKRHIQAAHSDSVFQCDKCNSKFTRRDCLSSHMKIHAVKEFKCKLCPAEFFQKESLDKHNMLHATKECCNICHKFFSSQKELACHLKKHSPAVQSKEKRSFMCELCSKTFSTRTLLSKHMKTHHSNKNCESDSTHSSAFSVNKNDTCDNLGSSVDLTKDSPREKTEVPEESVSIDGSCIDCDNNLTGNELMDLDNKEAHKPKVTKLRNVEREKRFFCDICSKGFTRSCNLDTHKLRAHGSNESDSYYFGSLHSYSHIGRRKKYASFSDVSESNFTDAVEAVNTANALMSCAFPLPHDSVSPPSHLLPHLPLSSSQLKCDSTDSPINLSAEAITAAACLLAYPSYTGSYH